MLPSKIAVELRELVSGKREGGKLAAYQRRKDNLTIRPGGIVLKPRHELLGGVSELPDVQVIEIGIVLRAGGNRGSTQHRGFASGMDAASNIFDLAPLGMHSAHEHGVGPSDVLALSPVNVFIDEADFPELRERGGDHEQTLRRH